MPPGLVWVWFPGAAAPPCAQQASLCSVWSCGCNKTVHLWSEVWCLLPPAGHQYKHLNNINKRFISKQEVWNWFHENVWKLKMFPSSEFQTFSCDQNWPSNQTLFTFHFVLETHSQTCTVQHFNMNSHMITHYWLQISWYWWVIIELSSTAASLWCCLLLLSHCVQGTPSSAGNDKTVSPHTPAQTLQCISLCICTSSSLIFSSAVFCLSISWLLISSFDWRMNLKHTHTPGWWCHTCLVLVWQKNKTVHVLFLLNQSIHVLCDFTDVM